MQSKQEFDQRDLVKQPLTADELAKLAKKAGGARELVAPKKRAEAEAVADGELIGWLAADGKRVRRPILESGAKLTLGFAAGVQEKWE